MSTAGFAVVAGLPAGCNFLMTLLLVRTLTVAQFATWSVIEPTFLIFSTLTALGLQFGLLFVTASHAATPRAALGTAMVIAAPVAILAGSLVWLVMRGQLPGVGYPALVFVLAVETMSLLTIASMRGQRLISRWIAFEAVRSAGPVALVGGALLFTTTRIDTIEGLLLVRGGFTLVAVVAIAASQRAYPMLDRALLMRMLRYGFPMVLAAGVTATISGADRFLLALLERPAVEIAQYAAHQRLAGLLSVAVVAPLNLWFAVEAIRRDTVAQASFFHAVLIAVAGGLALMVAMAFVIGPLVWPYLFPKLAFSPVIYALLAGAVIPQAIAIVTNIGTLREKNTHVSIITAGTSGSVMLVVGWSLIGLFGGSGAAGARFAALLSTAVVGRAMSQRIAPVSHRLRPLAPFALAVVLASIGMFASRFGMSHWPWAVGSLAAWGWGAVRNYSRLRSIFARG